MKNYPLNAVYLKNRMTELGLKQWWLAEQVGVDKKTVMRWLQGSVKTIKEDNLAALKIILECQEDHLVLKDEADHIASVDDQKNAAKLLMASSIVDKLGPIGEWNVIEALLKATIIEHLPLHILGEMYANLTVSLWRQSKMKEAQVFNQKTLEIAHKLNDQELLAKALLSKANLVFWRGQSKQAIETYQSILKLEKYIEPKIIGSTHSNLSACYYETAYYKEGLQHQLKAIEIFQSHGKPVNLSIAYCHLSLLSLYQFKLSEARSAIQLSIKYAELDQYSRGLAMGELILGEIEAREHHHELALKHLDAGLKKFQSLKIEESLNYEFAGRIYRLLVRYEEAHNMIRIGLPLSSEFPLSKASLLVELGLLQKAQENKQSLVSFQQAIEILNNSEAFKKAQEVSSYVT
jgi:tetratricopeptide (TPR) repeat protein